MKPNPGYCPADLEGTAKRVKVRLRNGSEPEEPWPASGKGALRWSLGRSPFDVVEYQEV